MMMVKYRGLRLRGAPYNSNPNAKPQLAAHPSFSSSSPDDLTIIIDHHAPLVAAVIL